VGKKIKNHQNAIQVFSKVPRIIEGCLNFFWTFISSSASQNLAKSFIHLVPTLQNWAKEQHTEKKKELKVFCKKKKRKMHS
jgi:hypothetical protein